MASAERSVGWIEEYRDGGINKRSDRAEGECGKKILHQQPGGRCHRSVALCARALGDRELIALGVGCLISRGLVSHPSRERDGKHGNLASHGLELVEARAEL